VNARLGDGDRAQAPRYSLVRVATKASERDELNRSAAPGPIVLETKLTRPPVRAEYVPRRDLIEALREGATRLLTVLTAPPGFGKTTLLAAWSADHAVRVAWLSLDDDDNDPARFFVHLVAALRSVEPGIVAHAPAAHGAAGASPVALLLNELAAVEDELSLVLDDYHLITNAHIHEGLTYLVEHLPRSTRVVVATREDPPFPLGRLRARGELTELRAGELRFSDAEARTFLNDSLGLDLSERDIALLQARTEGWPAALYLAALTLRGQPNTSSLIEAFAGDDRHVVDYLTGEVLARQTPELRSFLLRTSILTRMCGPLCDAIIDGNDSARTLDELERSNLLVVPLDSKRHWYRYHHLFADLLQHELKRSEPDAPPLLHRRASGWYRDAGLIVEAAHHAYAAGDLDAAVELVGRYWPFFLDQGQLGTLSRWLEALPDDLLGENRTLCYAAAMIASHTGRLDEAERWLETAGRAPPSGLDEPGIPLEALAAWLPMARGDMDRAIAAARLGLAAASSEPATAAGLQLLLGSALWWSQQSGEAKPLLDSAARTAEATGLSALAVMALGVRAALELDAGVAGQAEALAQKALELMRRAELEEHGLSGIAHIVIGKTDARHGELGEATARIEHGIELSELEHTWHITVYGLLALAEARHRAHEPAEARRLLARARATVEALPSAGPAALARIEQTERTLRLRPAREREPGGSAFSELSERELAVLRLLASKLSQREIAAELYVSFNTVKTHTRAIFRKLGAASRAEAVARARELGLL
jgi:LuxR family transcriptional regulator, maltose regulon positive regulatory protein